MILSWYNCFLMASPERKEALTPFPSDPNKFEINKWMFANGLPVPEIYPDVVEAQKALESGVDVLARGYLIDKGVGKNGRQFCADELLIDVLPTENVYEDCGETFDRLMQKGSDILHDSDFRTYCQECGIDPQDLQVGYFLQRDEGEEKPVRVWTADFIPGVISVEGINGDETFGNFFASHEDSRISSNWVLEKLKEPALELHRLAQEKLTKGCSYDRWQLEMIARLNDEDDEQSTIADLSLVQARRIPFADSGFKIIEKPEDLLNVVQKVKPGTVVKNVDIKELKNKIDFSGIGPYLLVLGGSPYSFGNVNMGIKYGELQGVFYGFDWRISCKLLSHEHYRMLALCGAKNCPFYLNDYYYDIDVDKQIVNQLASQGIFK